MKILKTVTIFLLLFAIQSCGQNNKESKNDGKKSTEESSPKGTLATADADYETYLELRNALLDINPTDFGFGDAQGKAEVFGIVIDLNRNDSISTISAYKTGDVSVYKSSGKLYMAGIQVPKFKEMGLDFVNEAQNFISLTSEVENRDLPKFGFAKFYFVTTNGIRQYENEIKSIFEQDDDWKKLIDKGIEIENSYVEAVEK